MALAGNRRRDYRLDKVFSVYITGDSGSAFGIARNISEGGMFIETNELYPLSSRMQVTFSFPECDTEMTAMAEVVHLCFLDRTAAGGLRSVLTGIGVRFMGFVEEEQVVHPSIHRILQ